jgi:hypothetical protein
VNAAVEQEVVQELASFARVLRKAKDPRRAKAAAEWEIFFQDLIGQGQSLEDKLKALSKPSK